MLYVETSALVKRYAAETGSIALRKRLAESRRIFTSWIAFAEFHTLLNRKRLEAKRAPRPSVEFDKIDKQLEELFEQFRRDCVFSFDLIEVDQATLSELPAMLRKLARDFHVSLRSLDAVHLATAVWLRNMLSMAPESLSLPTGRQPELVFVTAEERLTLAAQKMGFSVFNPEKDPFAS